MDIERYVIDILEKNGGLLRSQELLKKFSTLVKKNIKEIENKGFYYKLDQMQKRKKIIKIEVPICNASKPAVYYVLPDKKRKIEYANTQKEISEKYMELGDFWLKEKIRRCVYELMMMYYGIDYEIGEYKDANDDVLIINENSKKWLDAFLFHPDENIRNKAIEIFLEYKAQRENSPQNKH